MVSIEIIARFFFKVACYLFWHSLGILISPPSLRFSSCRFYGDALTTITIIPLLNFTLILIEPKFYQIGRATIGTIRHY